MKLKYQLFWVILLTGLISVVLLNVYRYKKIKQIIIDYSINNFEGVADLKAKRIKEVLDKKIYKGRVLANDLIEHTPIGSSTCNGNECTEKINHQIATYRLFNLKSITVLDENGLVIGSSDTIYSNEKKDYRQYLEYSRKKKPFLKGQYLGKAELLITYSTPIWRQNELIGVLLIAEIDNDIINLTNEYTGLGNSGETYIGIKDSQTTFINPLRYDRNAAGKKHIHSNDTSLAINKALLFKRGGICPECKDYRGIKVLSFYQFIPETNWGIVTELDIQQLFVPIWDVMKIFIVLALLSFFLIALFAYLLGSYISRPLENLIGSINKFKLGKLSTRSNVKLNNEIGILASTFNEMADTIERKTVSLNKSNQSLNKFGYSISHDLKSPVQSIYSLVELIKSEYTEKPLTGDGLKMLDMMSQKAKMMEEMIGNVLEMAKTGGKFQEKTDIDSLDVVNEVLSNISIPSNFKIEVDNNLPEVYYNKIALYQIFQNLVTNALKYNDKEKGKVEISFEDREKKYCFYVKDNGRGINEKDYYTIFNIFSSAKKEDLKKKESSGIGLSTVKGIVTENFGEIWVESELGEGSTFYFTIPKHN